MSGPCLSCMGHGCVACAYEPECPGCGEAAPLRVSPLPREEAAEMGRVPMACSRCGRLAEPTDGRLLMRGGVA